MSKVTCPVKECGEIFKGEGPEQVIIDLHAHYRKYHEDESLI